MPGVIINLGFVKVNTMGGNASINVGDNYIIGQRSSTKTNTGGASVVGDGAPTITPTLSPINNDPAVIDAPMISPV